MPLLSQNNPLNKPVALSNIIWVIIVMILLAGNYFFATKYYSVQKELNQTQAVLQNQKTNEKVLDFTKLFIEKVLKANTEIDFETRLQLENTVRNLEDKEILSQWQKFIKSKTEAEVQEEVKNLLEMLVGKIMIQ